MYKDLKSDRTGEKTVTLFVLLVEKSYSLKCVEQGYQTTARGAISSDPGRHCQQ